MHKKYITKIDKLQSKLASGANKKLQSTLNSLRIKVRNQVDNLHKQTAAYLLKRYKIIVIGDFNSKGNTTRLGNRKISKKTVRHINLLAHCRFKDYITYRSSLAEDRYVLVINEAYTSKTCGKCGHIHKLLGSSKVYVCPECGYTADRDWHAARNILLKSIL